MLRIKPDEGKKLKEEGMSRALKAALITWKTNFTITAVELALTDEPFTSEDVLDIVGLPRGEIIRDGNNAVGALMNGLAKQGLIIKTGRHVTSRRPSSHGAELTEWIGA